MHYFLPEIGSIGVTPRSTWATAELPGYRQPCPEAQRPNVRVCDHEGAHLGHPQQRRWQVQRGCLGSTPVVKLYRPRCNANVAHPPAPRTHQEISIQEMKPSEGPISGFLPSLGWI